MRDVALLIALLMLFPVETSLSAQTAAIAPRADRSAGSNANPQPSGGDLLNRVATTEITLVRSADGVAVLRTATGPLTTVHVRDRVGRTHAVVREITRGRMVLDETFTGADGLPNSAQIIFKDGEKGGTRYLRRPDEKRPPPTRQVTVAPSTGPSKEQK